jgi:predicted permease
VIARIVAILFPLFAIAALGFWIGRKRQPDLSDVTVLNMDVFVPALVISALAGRTFHVAAYGPLLLATLGVMVGCGLLGWLVARLIGMAPKTLVPSLMFNNSANLGIPVAVLTFGDQALAPAVAMFMVSNLLHFSFGAWLLDHQTRWITLWRSPPVLATLVGLTISALGASPWPPLMLALRMVGDISIPLMIFSLGVRLAQSPLSHLRTGLVGASLRPALGIMMSLAMSRLIGLSPTEEAMLLVFGALPPAVLNYIFAERYHQEPEKAASMVLTGNLASVVTLPLVLGWVLSHPGPQTL